MHDVIELFDGQLGVNYIIYKRGAALCQFLLHSDVMEQTLQKKKRKIKHICLQCDQVFDRAQRLKDHQSKKSCSTVCTRCNHKFRDRSQLEKHRLKASPEDCDLCDQKFCNLTDYNRHRIVEHRGGQIEEPDEEYTNILNEIMFTTTGQEESEGYKELVEKNYSLIKDKIDDRIGVMMKVNRELVPGFTYQDLRNQIVEALLEHKKVARFNVGFGFILWNKLTQVYRFYYVSTNTLLFDKAETISKISDVKDIVKKIHDMNVQDRYYMMRPNSSWMIAGVTNLQFKLTYINLPLG
jgi:hypothetical protein